jgi:ubiquinol-cytochrome c reductase cytochrome b subunit
MASRLQALWGWFDARMPSVAEQWKIHAAEYYAPKNFNFWYFFGSLALLVLVIQIVSGIFLTMNYKPDAALAFGSVEYIMRDVPGGWLIRYIHSTGASAFFIVVYLHMFRAMLYGSYREPRELVWIFGVLIYLTLMGEAFFGYLLPWGQMSYWGAQVIVNLFGTCRSSAPTSRSGSAATTSCPTHAQPLLRPARDRFPLVLLGLVVAHILALHDVGSNNPDGSRDQEAEGARRQTARRHPVPPLLHGEGSGRGDRCSSPSSAS